MVGRIVLALRRATRVCLASFGAVCFPVGFEVKRSNILPEVYACTAGCMLVGSVLFSGVHNWSSLPDRIWEEWHWRFWPARLVREVRGSFGPEEMP